MNKELLNDFTITVRNSTLKRLEEVPAGSENWKISAASLSFAEIAKHLIDIDQWIIRKIKNPNLLSIETQTAAIKNCTPKIYLQLINELKDSLNKKLVLFNLLSEEMLNEKIFEDSLDREVSLALFILRRNLDHEIHHRGQIALYLGMINKVCGE